MSERGPPWSRYGLAREGRGTPWPRNGLGKSRLCTCHSSCECTILEHLSKTCTSTWATWQACHRKWDGDGVPLVPLLPDNIRDVAAYFKEGGYSSFTPYMTIAKEAHVLEGHELSTSLEMCANRAAHSMTRDVGMCRRSKPLDLLKNIDVVDEDAVELQPVAPVGWRILFTVDAYVILTEIELATMPP